MSRVEGLLAYSRANFSYIFLRVGESFTREQKGGLIKMLTCLARLPFLDRNPPCRASFSSYKLLSCSPSYNSSRSRRDNQRTRERGC